MSPRITPPFIVSLMAAPTFTVILFFVVLSNVTVSGERERERECSRIQLLALQYMNKFLRIHQGPWVSDASLKDILEEQLSTLTESSGPLSEELVLLPLALLS